jgi:hypothetical protein
MTQSLARTALLTFLALIVHVGGARAQMDQAISGKEMLDPWVSAKEVVASLAPLLASASRAASGSQLEGRLSRLEDELALLNRQMQDVAVKIAGNPSFGYQAPERALEMSSQIRVIREAFEPLFSDLGVSDRADVAAALGSMQTLQNALAERNRFERDVVGAIGSGSKNQIVALAERWWAASEGVADVKTAVIELRGQLPQNAQR